MQTLFNSMNTFNFKLCIFLFQDAFFYCLVFDPSQKTLLADKGEIKVGSRYQTEVTNLLKEGKDSTNMIICYSSICIQ